MIIEPSSHYLMTNYIVFEIKMFFFFFFKKKKFFFLKKKGKFQVSHDEIIKSYKMKKRQ